MPNYQNVIATVGKYRLVIFTDDSAPSPRECMTNYAHVAALSQSPDRHRPDPDDGPLARLAETHREESVRRGETHMAAKWFIGHVRVLGGHAIEGEDQTVWYVTIADIEKHGISDPETLVKSERDIHHMWNNCEVYTFAVEEQVLWARVDKPSETRTTWETVESISNIYGFQDAEIEGRAHLEHWVSQG